VDIDKSMQFYHRLGFRLHKQKNEDSKFIDCISNAYGVKLRTTRLVNIDGDMIELLEYGKHAVLQTRTLFGTGIAHFALTVKDISLYKNLGFLAPPTVDPQGYAKVAFCVAPEGTFIELVEVLKGDKQ